MHRDTVEKITRAQELIKGGMFIYKACDTVGINLRTYYRVTSGEDSLAQKRLLQRLKSKRKKLLGQIELIDAQIKEVEK